jgi:hypothetical protein
MLKTHFNSTTFVIIAHDALICLAIAPDAIFFNLWSKAEVTTDKAGKLVSMEKGANASYKLTKRRDGLIPIASFENYVQQFLAQ